MLKGDVGLLGLVASVTSVAAMVAYQSNRTGGPGLMTVLALLVLTSLLGGLAGVNALLAAGVRVLPPLLLVARNAIHHFVQNLHGEQDLQDCLLECLGVGRGLVWGAQIAGLADAHAAAASTASLLTDGKIQAMQAVLPILLGLSANTLTRMVVAFHSGGVPYAHQVVPGLVFMTLAVWLGN